MTNEVVQDSKHTSCVVVGGGPAGMIMSLLLARRGVDVTLLEAHKDFDRDFRGDTIHPSTLEVLDEIGLSERLLQIPHGQMRALRVVTPQGTTTMADLSRLRSKFPYVAMMPQVKFLDFLAAEARLLPHFCLELGANVQRLVQENGTVVGVRYRGGDDAWHEVRAPLTVAADGRFSKVRSLAGLEPIRTSPPVDVVWFRLPRRPHDRSEEGSFHIHGGHFVILLDRADEWQLGYIILKGGYPQIRAAGIDALRRSLVDMVPWLADRIDTLQDWKQFNVLSVESNRLPQWYQPGLLLIGDAAHAMSPVGGVGINYAIQDAVEAANVLAPPLLKGQVQLSDLAAVQKLREWPVKVIQRIQTFAQENIARPALSADKPFRLPLLLRILLRLPFFRNLPAQMIGYGVKRVHVET